MNDLETRKPDIFATLASVGSLICWTTGPIFIKYLTGYLDSWTQNLLRYATACLFWLVFLIWSVTSGRIDHRVWRKAAMPAAANVVMQSFWAASFYYIDPAFMNLLIKSSVIWIAAFSIIFFADERALAGSRKFWLGVVLSAAGICGVLFLKEGFAERKTATGIVMALTAAFLWAVYTISVKAAFKDIDARVSFAVICLYTVGGLGVLAMVFGGISDCLNMGLWQWSCVVISGLVAIALSHVLYYAAIKRIGATVPSLVLLGTPFTVLAVSHFVFSEALSGLQLLFGLVLLAGSALAIWAQGDLRIDG